MGDFSVCHVLIIEDETLIALDLEDVLHASGALSFSFAETQEAAVAAASLTKPDFILSDVSLIEGTGPLAVEAIRAVHGSIPVIFVTATPEACTPCAPPGEIFRKPLDRPAIAAAFRRMAFAA
jgi:CheY-like chemotaxis protein